MAKRRMARFEVYRDRGQGWRWRLVATNGEIVAQGESYTRKRDVQRAAQAVINALVDVLLVSVKD